ncbi:protodermal factor 1 [Ricinus communis]|uniref:protodermal factor 1 n=1 Tax=Ricinus communis TaxID=3988 RepID=UPI00201A3562|nr:protodermal factor 1 [Ricinus communis]
MGKEKCKQHASVLMWVFAAGLISQSFLVPVMATTTYEDQKNYYSPDPHAGSPPTGSHGSHSHVPTPSHGTPSHGSGGGSYGGSPPTHSTPSNPSPSNGNCGTPPSTPSHPPSGGGGYYPPSPPTGGSTPTPVTPTPVTPTPTTPYVPTPTTPTPTTPYVPSPPFIPDPNSPFSCNYWRTHPAIIWGLLGWWGTVGSAFGTTSVPGLGASMSLQQALSNTRTDGYGTLYREGTASLLNSMVSNKFPFTTRQVRESFIAALGSNKVAAAQGHLFKLANEGRLKPRN